MARRRSSDNGDTLSLRLERLKRARQRAADRLEQLQAVGHDGAWWMDEITPEHPLAAALGHREAVAMAAMAKAAAEKETCPSGLSACDRSLLATRRLAEVKAMSEAGRSVNAITADLGLSPGYVVQLRAKCGTGRRLRESRAAHVRAEVERLSKQGLPVAEIARTLGLSYYYVVQLRAALGLSKSRGGK